MAPKMFSRRSNLGELGLETLEERRQKQDMPLVYKMTQDDQMTSMFEKARSNNHGARTRQATAHQGLAVQYARTDIRKRSFAVRVVEKWNHLPDSIKMAPNKESFKRGLNPAAA